MIEAYEILNAIGELDVEDQFISLTLDNFSASNVVRIVEKTNCAKPIIEPVRGTTIVYEVVGKPQPQDLSICRGCKRLLGSGGCPIYDIASVSY